MSVSEFASWQLHSKLLEALHEQNIHTPTDIQARAIPRILAGDDVIARSDTGTGKTLAYLLPLLQRLNPDATTVQAVVLAPTQELAVQIAAEANHYGAPLGLSTVPLIGGASVRRQLDKLKSRPQLVTGTAGRLLELINMKKLKMHGVQTIVIDEADHVLAQGEMSLADDIIGRALRDRQLLLFSATIPDDIVIFATAWSDRFVKIGLEQSASAAATIAHHYHVGEQRSKVDLMRRLVHAYHPQAAIIFVNDGDQIEQVAAKLKHVGLSLEALHSQADKRERALVLQRFRAGQFPLLLATDMAARGLDLEGLTHVFHYDPAFNAEFYIHRAGRTGRMGRQGISISLVTPDQQFIMTKFARELGITIQAKAVSGGRVVEAGADRHASGIRGRVPKPKQARPPRSPKRKASNLQSKKPKRKPGKRPKQN